MLNTILTILQNQLFYNAGYYTIIIKIYIIHTLKITGSQEGY
jgi:hypothetical protein